MLCEKPIALDAAEAQTLLEARDRTGVLIQEAAMIRVHPRWLATRAELAKGSAGKIGELRSIVSSFGYDLRQRDNVRYRREMGGGTLLDVGFYPVSISRFCFGAEPDARARVADARPRDRRRHPGVGDARVPDAGTRSSAAACSCRRRSRWR